MRKSSLTLAIGLHVLVIVASIISFPWLKKDFEIPTAVSVELVDISQMAQTVKVAPKPVKEEKKEEKPPENKPPPAPTNTATEPVTPVKEKVDEKKEELKKDEVLVDENAPPEKKIEKKDEKKKKVTQAPPQKDFTSVLKNLAAQKEKPIPAPATPDIKTDSTPTPGQNLPIGPKMTMTEMDALRVQLQGCWNVPIGAKDADKLQVDIFMVISPERTLLSAKVVDSSRYNNDSFFRAMADSALRAVRNPLCSPFQLPPDKYETWKATTVTFDPSQMF